MLESFGLGVVVVDCFCFEFGLCFDFDLMEVVCFFV